MSSYSYRRVCVCRVAVGARFAVRRLRPEVTPVKSPPDAPAFVDCGLPSVSLAKTPRRCRRLPGAVAVSVRLDTRRVVCGDVLRAIPVGARFAVRRLRLEVTPVKSPPDAPAGLAALAYESAPFGGATWLAKRRDAADLRSRGAAAYYLVCQRCLLRRRWGRSRLGGASWPTSARSGRTDLDGVRFSSDLWCDMARAARPCGAAGAAARGVGTARPLG